GIVSLVVAILGTPVAIRVLAARGYGQLIRDDGPTTHQTKRGTPTMGGAVIIIAVVCGFLVAHLTRGIAFSASGLLVMLLLVGLGLVGFLDDYIKISKQRSLGLRSGAKMSGQIGVAVLFAILAMNFPDEQGLTPASTAISFLRDTPIVLPAAVFVIWALVMVAGSSNAVNLTDGLDGLATGAATMVFGAYTLIGVWQLNQSCGVDPGPACYEVRDPLDLAIVAS